MAQHEITQPKTNPPPAQPISRSPSEQELDRPLPALPSPSKLPSPTKSTALQTQKTRKRKSSAIRIPSDKENHEPDSSIDTPDDLAVQKNAKRAKTAAAPAPAKRNASRTQKKPLQANGNPSGVLSPRSHNSRTLPRSPIKDKELPIPEPIREASPLRQYSPQRPASPSKIASPFKAATSALSSLAKRGYAAAGAAGARLTRPISREKDQAILSGTGTTIPAEGSPIGKMLPPPRPALATLTSTSVPSLPTMSPQRTTSQASIRSNTSEQSSNSITTVVTKQKISRTLTKKAPVTAAKPSSKKITATASTAAKIKGKVVVSGAPVSSAGTLSPKATNATVKRTGTVTATAKRMVAATTAKKAAAAAPTATTGRVLRKRN